MPKDGKITKVEKIKKHVSDNKKAYICAGVGIAVGAGAVLIIRKPTIIQNNVLPVFNNTPVINNDNSSNVVNFGGPVSKIVERVSDGKLWKKVKLAAEEIAQDNDVPFERAMWLLSRHLNGHIPNVYGVEYIPAGLSTTG